MTWLRRNWLYLLAFTLPFERIPSYDLQLGGHSLTLRASFILALIIVGVAAWQVMRRRRLALSAPDKWLCVYVLVMVASMGAAYSRSRSVQVIVATVLVIGLALVLECTVREFSLSKVYRYILGATVVVCLFGLFQFFGDIFGLSTAVTGLKDIYTKHVFGFPRIQSVGLEPLFFASFLLLPLMLLISQIYTKAAGWKQYGLLWFIVLVFALTLSRGGIYGGVAALIVLTVLLRKNGSYKRLGMVVVTLAVAAGSAMGIIALTSRTDHTPNAPAAIHNYVAQSTHLTATATSADSDRAVNSRLAVQAFKQHPLIGVGIGNFGYFAQRNDVRYVNNPSVVVNDEYLEILAETGILGLLALLGFALTLLWRVHKAWGSLEGETRVWVAAILAVLIGSAVQFYSFSTLYIIQIWFSIGLLLALTGGKAAAKRNAAKAQN